MQGHQTKMVYSEEERAKGTSCSFPVAQVSEGLQSRRLYLTTWSVVSHQSSVISRQSSVVVSRHGVCSVFRNREKDRENGRGRKQGGKGEPGTGEQVTGQVMIHNKYPTYMMKMVRLGT